MLKKQLGSCALLLILFLASFDSSAQSASQYQSRPDGFIKNTGFVLDQSGRPASAVKFIYLDKNAKVQFRNAGFSYELSQIQKERLFSEATGHSQEEETIVITHRIDVSFAGASINKEPVTKSARHEKVNLFLPQYSTSTFDLYASQNLYYNDIYNGIDAVFISKAGKLKYEFLVKPGADASQIKLNYNGANKLQVDSKGNLLIYTSLGIITEQAPVSYQQGKKIPTKFILKGNEVYYELGRYNAKESVVIDPGVIFSTYYGGNSADYVEGMDKDADGNLYVAGYTASSDFIATTGAYQQKLGGSNDGFIVKLDATGKRLWSTYYGGSSDDFIKDIATNIAGNFYVVGYTRSSNGISTKNTYQTSLSDGIPSQGDYYDGMIAYFGADGKIKWGTYYGDDPNDYIYAADCDTAGSVYFGGATKGSKGLGSGSTLYGQYDGIYGAFDTTGKRTLASYFGDYFTNTPDDYIYDVHVDAKNNLYLTGKTESLYGIASGNAHQNKLATTSNFDAFLVKKANDGSSSWATYYGGTGNDIGNAITADENGNVYLVGQTASYSGTTAIIATKGAFIEEKKGGDAGFLVKFLADGTRDWGTYYGFANNTLLSAIDFDSKLNQVVVAGTTNDNTVLDTFTHQRSVNGSNDALVARFTAAGKHTWATYFGGSSTESAEAVIVIGDAYFLGGLTGSTQNVVFGAATDSTFAGNSEGYIAKFGNISSPTVASTNAKVSNITCSKARLSWSPGNGSRQLVILRAGQAVNFNPINGSSYSADSTFGLSQNLGNGHYAVSINNNTSVQISNLSESTTYYYAVYEVNGYGDAFRYYNQPLTGSFTTGTADVSIAINKPAALSQCFLGNYFNLAFTKTGTGNIASVKWSLGNGDTIKTNNANYSYKQAGKYTIALEATTTGGCILRESFNVEVLANEKINGIITGSSKIKPNVSGTYSTRSISGATYHWKVKNGTIAGAPDKYTVNITWPNTGTDTVSVFVEFANGCYSDTIRKAVSIEYGVGMEDFTESQLKLYPNPAKTLLFIDLPSRQNNLQITVQNTLGQAENLPVRFNGPTAVLDVNNLESGIYIITVKNGNNTYREIFIKE